MSTSVALKLTQIGNSVGVILPKEVLARLKVQKGDSLFVTDLPDGVALRPFRPGIRRADGDRARSCANTATCCANWPNEFRQRDLALAPGPGARFHPRRAAVGTRWRSRFA